MKFDYDLYLSGCLIFPIFVTVIAVPGLISCVKKVLGIVIEQRESRGNLDGFLIGIIISCVCCALSIGPLLSGGLCLLVERESDAIEIQGEITQIREMPRIIFPALTNDYDSEKVGVRIVVDDEEYILPTRGTLQVGDYATVRYLPQSGYVLHISSEPHEGEMPPHSHDRNIESVLAWMVIIVIAFIYFLQKRKKTRIIRA